MRKHSGSGHGGGGSAKRGHQRPRHKAKQQYAMPPWRRETTPRAQARAAVSWADRLNHLLNKKEGSNA